MAVKRWNPCVELTKQEQFIIAQLNRVRKPMPFLRRHRHELVDDKFQEELTAMYRETGAGIAPVTPALMAMASLVQGLSLAKTRSNGGSTDELPDRRRR